MPKEEAGMCFQFDAHAVYLATKGQGGDECRLMRFGHITSTHFYTFTRCHVKTEMEIEGELNYYTITISRT